MKFFHNVKKKELDKVNFFHYAIVHGKSNEVFKNEIRQLEEGGRVS